MATATSFASPQMNWDAPDPITAFARSNKNVNLCSQAFSKTPMTKKKWAIFCSGRVKKAWIYTTVGHSQRRKIGKSLPLFSNGSRINWNRRRVIKFTDTHYKQGGKGGVPITNHGPILLQITNHVRFSECFTNHVLNFLHNSWNCATIYTSSLHTRDLISAIWPASENLFLTLLNLF